MDIPQCFGGFFSCDPLSYSNLEKLCLGYNFFLSRLSSLCFLGAEPFRVCEDWTLLHKICHKFGTSFSFSFSFSRDDQKESLQRKEDCN